MKKQLNTDAIANELRELSPFFQRRPEPPAAEQAKQHSSPPPAGLPPDQAVHGHENQPSRTGSTPRTARTPRTASLPAKRHMKRHAFEIYHDQYDSLVHLAAQERMAGGGGSMSQMIREALDRLIAERSRERAG